jgi:hypothetical protein
MLSVAMGIASAKKDNNAFKAKSGQGHGLSDLSLLRSQSDLKGNSRTI